MKVIRTTLVTPLQGADDEVVKILGEIGEHMAKQPGFIEAYTFEEDGKIGRLSMWESREDADHAANQLHTMALRSRMNALTLPAREERLLEIRSERHGVAAKRKAA